MPSIVVHNDLVAEKIKISNRTISGNVQLLGVGVERIIKIFRNNDTFEYATTKSDSSGLWSVPVVGGDNDRFRCTAIGDGDNENSITFDKVVAG